MSRANVANVPKYVDRVSAAVDQDASFVGRAFNDSCCQNLPLGRRENVWQQCARLRLFRGGLLHHKFHYSIMFRSSEATMTWR